MDSDQPEESGHFSRKLSAQSWGNPGGGVLATLCPWQGRLGVSARVWLGGVLPERLVLEWKRGWCWQAMLFGDWGI